MPRIDPLAPLLSPSFSERLLNKPVLYRYSKKNIQNTHEYVRIIGDMLMKLVWLLGATAWLLAPQSAFGYQPQRAISWSRSCLVLRSSSGYEGMTVVELKEALKGRGLASSGLKQVLIQRLQGACLLSVDEVLVTNFFFTFFKNRK